MKHGKLPFIIMTKALDDKIVDRTRLSEFGLMIDVVIGWAAINSAELMIDEKSFSEAYASRLERLQISEVVG